MRPPTSAVPATTGWIGVAAFAVALALWLCLRPHPALGLVMLLGFTAAPMWWYERRRFAAHAPYPVIGLTAKQRREWRFRGLLMAAPVWLTTLWVFSTFSPNAVVGFWGAASWLWPGLVIALVLYVARPGTAGVEGLEKAGRWWTQRNEPFPWPQLRDQLVKAFFLPLMLAFAYVWLVQTEWKLTENPALLWYSLTIAFLYLLDTVFAAIGYLSTSEQLDAQIRSSNPHWLAWISALLCYPPFFPWLQAIGFNYRDGYEWQHWLDTSDAVFYVWGAAILLLTALYAWATVAFGIRFSNLTNRGIVTNGPYRFTKHPAYLTKNASWWLISIPFISSGGPFQAFLHCLILLGMNGIYWVRARTEERHLLSDPNYAAYADWIAQHGMLAQVRRFFFAGRITQQ